MEKRFNHFAQLVAVLILAAGCLMVLRPFIAATLLAAVMCVSTWPLHLWLLHKLKDRQNIAALAMTLSLVLVIILPLALVAYNLTDNVSTFYNWIKQAVEAGAPDPPAWLKGVPIVGGNLDEYWHLLATNRGELITLEKNLFEPVKNFLLAGGSLLGQGVLQMSLAAFVSFFLYRHGVVLMNFLNVAMARLIGTYAANVLDNINNTIKGVTCGLLGTALAQSSLAIIGFSIAGVPEVLLLGVLTFMLSLLPIGPPLIWGGAAIWLFYQGSAGWGVFMLLWGFFLISGVDNVLKPLLISRSSNMPFILVLFGVMGGVMTFGFVGIFIGPTLLAVTFRLIHEWVARAPIRSLPSG